MCIRDSSKKRKLVRDGVFAAELYEFLKREVGADGFAGVSHVVTPTRTEIIVRATKTQEVLGENGRRIRELTSLVQKRFKYDEGKVQLFVERVVARSLSAMAQAETLKFKLMSAMPVLCVDTCLLYTSDAADDLLCVDLGGRRIIKKKKNK
eukprot:TRINITY_DN2275_c0_g1_i2.p1 TRINITY_DN2275_c0_g1~~TRINITY_DN2275_c0_g1_i2.p1  ORF type:complete len:151 (-),score=87.17 TRINITY_DN2275_c0_g1_i2:107-559(-)